MIEAAGLVFRHTWGAKEGQVELAPRAVIAKFKHTCERTGLDPLARQIYVIGRGGRDGVEWSIQTAIDGFRVIAERSGKYAGQDAPEWLTADGEWVPVFIKSVHGAHPLAARVAVHRSDWPGKPAIGIATWEEYAQTKTNGGLTKMWEQRGPGQLAKCAEALALRKAFPQDLSGIYTDDEMNDRAVVAEESTEVPSEDWLASINNAQTVAELEHIKERLRESGEGTDEMRIAWATRMGVLTASQTEGVNHESDAGVDPANADQTEQPLDEVGSGN